MNKNSYISIFISLFISSTSNASWDRNENLREAAQQWSNVYCSLGTQGMEDYIRGCYVSIQYMNGTIPQKLERCLAIDFIGSTVDVVLSAALKTQPSAYFTRSEMIKRTSNALSKVGVPENLHEKVMNFIGEEAFKHVTPCPTTDNKHQEILNYTEIKSALLDGASAIGKTINISGSFRSLDISRNAPYMRIKAITETELNTWHVYFSSEQRNLVENLRTGQKISFICRIIEFWPLPECALISMN